MIRLLGFLLLLGQMGCMSMSLKMPDGTVAEYQRTIMSQSIQGLTIAKDGNSTMLQMESQRSDSAILSDTIKELVKLK